MPYIYGSGMVAGAGVAMARCCLISSSLNMTFSSFFAARACLCIHGAQQSHSAHVEIKKMERGAPLCNPDVDTFGQRERPVERNGFNPRKDHRRLPELVSLSCDSIYVPVYCFIQIGSRQAPGPTFSCNCDRIRHFML